MATTATHEARCPVAPHAHVGPDHIRTYPRRGGEVLTIDLYWAPSISRWVTVPDADATPAHVRKGSRVRDRKWGGQYIGTVLRRRGRSVFIVWDGVSIEDELDLVEVEAVAE